MLKRLKNRLALSRAKRFNRKCEKKFGTNHYAKNGNGIVPARLVPISNWKGKEYEFKRVIHGSCTGEITNYELDNGEWIGDTDAQKREFEAVCNASSLSHTLNISEKRR